MVKFAKQLEGSLVPEWKGAYCNYKELKRDVNRVKQDRLLQSSAIPMHRHSLGSFSQLHNLGNHLRRTAHGLNSLSRSNDEVCTLLSSSSIRTLLKFPNHTCLRHNHLCVVPEQGPKNAVASWDDDDDDCVLYNESEWTDALGHGEQDRIFFNHLDGELEKINRFYKAKEAEYVSRAVRLERQLLALFQVQEALARQNLKMRTSSIPKAVSPSRNSSE